jgi:hypothetical protein
MKQNSPDESTAVLQNEVSQAQQNGDLKTFLVCQPGLMPGQPETRVGATGNPATVLGTPQPSKDRVDSTLCVLCRNKEKWPQVLIK